MAVLNSTAKSPTANSYLSVAEADDYVSKTGGESYATWQLKTTGEKERYLMWATILIERNWEFDGYKTTYEQALKWPRATVLYDRYPLDPNTVPQIVKDATAELARTLFQEDITEDVKQGISSLGLGSISVAFDSMRTGARLFPTTVSNMLAPLGGLSGSGTASRKWVR